MSKRDKEKTELAPEFRTEEQLKAEARERHRLQLEEEAAAPPKSPRRVQWENFWYHYKALVVAMTCGAVIVAFFVVDILRQVEPDIAIVMVSSQYIPNEYMEKLTRVLESAAPDANGDGRVAVSIDYIPYVPAGSETATQGLTVEEALDSGDANLEYAHLMKLMSIVAAGSDPIYLLDEANYKNLLLMGGDDPADPGMFLSLEDISGASGLALPASETILDLNFITPYFDELSFYFRDLSRDKKNTEYLDTCHQYLESIAK